MRKGRIMAAVMAAAMVCGAAAPFTAERSGCVITASALDYAEVVEGDLTFNVYSDYAVLVHCDESIAGNINVPSSINGVTVTCIEGEAFEKCEKLESVVIPNSIIDIGERAFNGCISLKSINIPNGVSTMRRAVFHDCEQLEEVAFPDSVETIEPLAFGNCRSLKTVSITKNIKEISSTAFLTETVGHWFFVGGKTGQRERGIESITVSEDNHYFSSIDGVLFNKDKTLLICYPFGKNCESNTYSIPNGVVEIGDYAFFENQNIDKIVFSNTVQIIGKEAFYACYFLKECELSSNLKLIKNASFSCTSDLERITLPKSLEKIGSGAFYYTGLCEITILNPDRDIYGGKETYTCREEVEKECIRGYVSSTAQAYAEKYGYRFEALDGEPPKTVSFGDPNCDGKVDSKDASFILAEYSKLSTGAETEPLPTEIKNAADVNADGMLDAKDASAILGYYSYISTGGSGDISEYMSKN